MKETACVRVDGFVLFVCVCFFWGGRGGGGGLKKERPCVFRIIQVIERDCVCTCRRICFVCVLFFFFWGGGIKKERPCVFRIIQVIERDCVCTCRRICFVCVLFFFWGGGGGRGDKKRTTLCFQNNTSD